MENRTLAALVDPIGRIAMSTMARYWTAAEKNTLLIPLAGELLWNRALWMAVGLAIMAFCYSRLSHGPIPVRAEAEASKDAAPGRENDGRSQWRSPPSRGHLERAPTCASCRRSSCSTRARR